MQAVPITPTAMITSAAPALGVLGGFFAASALSSTTETKLQEFESDGNRKSALAIRGTLTGGCICGLTKFSTGFMCTAKVVTFGTAFAGGAFLFGTGFFAVATFFGVKRYLQYKTQLREKGPKDL